MDAGSYLEAHPHVEVGQTSTNMFNLTPQTPNFTSYTPAKISGPAARNFCTSSLKPYTPIRVLRPSFHPRQRTTAGAKKQAKKLKQATAEKMIKGVGLSVKLSNAIGFRGASPTQKGGWSWIGLLSPSAKRVHARSF